MSIRAKLYTLAGLMAFVTATLIAASIIVGGMIQEQLRKADAAGSFAQSIAELSLLTDSYITHQEQRLENQWRSRAESVREFLSDPSTPEEIRSMALIFNSLSNSFDALRRSHLRKEAVLSGDAGGFTLATLQLIEERITARMRSDSQNLLSRAFTISGQAQEASMRMTQHSLTTVSLLGVALILACVCVTVIVVLNMTRGINLLVQGSTLMGQGRFDHRIALFGNDELGRLASAFNLMSDSIQDLVHRKRDTLARLNREIAQKDAAKELLRESEDRYRTLVDLAPEGIYVQSGGLVVFMNHAGLRLLGATTPEEIIGKDLMSLIHPDDRPIVSERLDAFRAGESVMPAREQRMLRLDGEFVDVEITAASIQYGGQPASLAFVRDISERKLSEAAACERAEEQKRVEASLRKSEERIRFALETSQIGAWDLDLVDQTAVRSILHDQIFGYDELLPQWTYEMFLAHIHPDDRDHVDVCFKDAVAKRQDWNFECRILRRDGAERWIMAAGRHVHDDSGSSCRMAGIVQDITKQKTAQEEILLLNAELEDRVLRRTEALQEANRELEAFSYSVSHDLRAPLRAIDGFTRILLEDHADCLDSEGKRVCGVIVDNSRRMGQLIDDLLTFSRLGREVMNRSIVDMTTQAQEAFDSLTSPQERERIDFHLGPLPPVLGDGRMLYQIWTNLIANAIKFSSRRDRAEIRVEAAEQYGEIVYSIYDNGAGFDMRYADKIFAVFQRLHTEREFPGTGVGLAIVQRIVTRHGGRVWAEGAVEQGAVFRFTLQQEGA